MSNIRQGHRFPLRPNAERSPSPDIGIKSIITATTSPKVNKQHTLSRNEKQQTISKIKEENRKLKDEMKILISRNKDDGGRDEDMLNRNGNGSIKRLDKRNHNKEIINNGGMKDDDQIEKINVSGRQNNRNRFTINQIKSQLSLLIRHRQNELFEKFKFLEQRLHASEKHQRKLEQQLLDYKKTQRTTTKKKSKQSSFRKEQQNSFQQDQQQSMNITFDQIKPKNSRYRDLQSQLKQAQQSIYRLERVLQIQGKQSVSLHDQLTKKEQLILQLKKQKQALANDLKESYKQMNQHRKSQLHNSSQMTQITNKLEQLKHTLSSKEAQIRQIKDKYYNELQQIQAIHQSELNEMKQQFAKSIQEHEKQISERSIRYEDETTKKNEQIVKILQLQIEDMRTKLEQAIQQKQKCLIQIEMLLQQNLEQKKQISQKQDVQNKITDQNAHISDLTIKLNQLAKSVASSQQLQKAQFSFILQQIIQIKQIAQSIILPQLSQSPSFNNELQKASLRHRQQILHLQATIQTLKYNNTKSISQNSQLQIQNSVLKQQINNLQQSIRKYCKTQPSIKQQTIITKQQLTIQTNSKITTQTKNLNNIVQRLNTLYSRINQN